MDQALITSQIYANFPYQATNNQKKVIESVAGWLSESDTSGIFVLNGYAGTGKTTILAALVSALGAMGKKTALLAPTGRAAKVLSRYSGRTASTIHRYIYHQKTNAQYESRFTLGLNKECGTLFIVDEASMIASNRYEEKNMFGSGSLLDDLVEYVRMGRGCRLMLVGDTAQLPPVGEDFSPALNAETVGMYGPVIYETMDEVVRQSQQSGILFNATLVRCMLEKGIITRPLFDLSFPDIERVEGSDLLEKLEDCYSRYGREETIIITRSNKRAIRYNEGVRKTVLCAEDELESSDRLMVVKNNYFYTESIEDCPVPFIANGDIARLKKLRREEALYGRRFVNATLAFDDYDSTEIDCKILMDTLHSESPSLSREEYEKFFYEVEKDYTDIASRIKRFQEIRRNPYFNALQIKYAYAITCHKAQGGQWKAVFVDRLLFGEEQMSRDMMRWLYTALTRATEKLYLVSFDDGFFDCK